MSIRNFVILKPRNQGTLKPRNQENKKPTNQETKKLRSQETKKPRNQETYPPTPQHADSHPCTRPPSWGTRVSLGDTSGHFLGYHIANVLLVTWQILVVCFSEIFWLICVYFCVFEKVGLKYRRKYYRPTEGELALNGGLLRPKIGIKHLT